MIYQNKLLRKILQPCILISLTAVILSGCGQKIEQDLAMQLPVQSAIALMQASTVQIKSRMQEGATEIKNRNMPEIEVSQDCIVKVKIHNAQEYQAFVGCLEEYIDYGVLRLDLAETDTAVYLDEILAYHNFEILTIKQGGTISVRDMENLDANPLRKIELYHAYAIEEDILSQMPDLQYIMIRLNSWYTGTLPVKELLQDTDCSNISIIWDDDGQEEVDLEGSAEWEEMDAMLSENNRCLKAVYLLNEDDCNYISYEFYREGTGDACEAFICIKDRESQGEKYFDILEVSVERMDISWLDGSRVRLEDINFDGYQDLLFEGYNSPLGIYSGCIGFLWNEKEQKYEWNPSVPKVFRKIETERKRITHTSTSSLEDDYYIYEYNGRIFTEKRLEVTGSITDYYLTTWQYYEDGKLLKRLEKNYDEDTELYYITYEENGIVTEETLEKVDYDNKYDSYKDLGKEYFPEFDFYWAG